MKRTGLFVPILVLLIATAVQAQQPDAQGDESLDFEAGGKKAGLGVARDKLKIVSLKIDDTPWKAKQSKLKGDIAYQKTKVADAERDWKAATERLERLIGEAKAAIDESNRAGTNWRDATDRLAGFSPPQDRKTAAYLRAERERDRWAKEAERIYEAIMLVYESRNIQPEPKYAIQPDGIFARLEAAEDNYVRAIAELRKLDRDLGFEGDRNELVGKVREAFEKVLYWNSKPTAKIAEADSAQQRVDELEARLHQTREELSRLEQELSRLDEGAIRIGGIRLSEGQAPHYEITFWDPSPVLRFIDKELRSLKWTLSEVEARRRGARADFLDAQKEASLAQDRVRAGIMKSAYAQGAVETVFNVIDVVEKTAEFGPLGALGEGGKKMMEAYVLGAPEFYEPAIVTGEFFADVGADLKAARGYAAKRLGKTAISGPVTNELRAAAARSIVAKFIETGNELEYKVAIGLAIKGSAETGYSVGSLAFYARNAFEALERAQLGHKKAIDSAVFKGFGDFSAKNLTSALKGVATKEFATSVGKSVVKDVTKMATKKALAEWLEGVPMANFMEKEANARITTQIFRTASAVYWETFDQLADRTAERQEILSQYKKKSQVNMEFAKEATLSITLMRRDEAGKLLPIPSEGRKVTVKVGGTTATPVPGNQLVYSIAAGDLVDGGTGEFALDVIIEQ